MIVALLLSGLLGMVGQGVRAVVGLKGLADQAADPAVGVPESFSAARLVVSMVIGFAAGTLAGIGMGLEQLAPSVMPSNETLLGLMAAGYAGTDFIEGFMSKYLPSQPAPTANPARMSAAANFRPSSAAKLLLPAPAAPLEAGGARVRAACELEWPANNADCSAFVRAVGQDLGAPVEGDANLITATLQSGGSWRKLADGRAAASAAAGGQFVVGGLAGHLQATPGPHGHVVVVVEGPLNRGQYPSAYWGSLGGTPAKDQTINWAWTAADRDKVTYASYDP